ncbi:MAG: glutamate-5-semialdehyde dehydrogenase [Planctomycetaceae bacterium]|jgi:glutamate-5-semialdehyde dehydrogenase|nr:glutamate-5-semialdehyde dehydrogenase [Planctomycetaceae bacterium]MDP7275087.1 glutamate-5-semialdehyde dehydrogenase [Planctomycetaceae bacterium]
MDDLKQYALTLATQARQASRRLGGIDGGQRNTWLARTAELLVENGSVLTEANERDLVVASENGLSGAAIDRLRLTSDRLAAMVTALQEIAALPDPVGEVIESNVRPNGLLVTRVRVPLGVVFFIFESRPNVTIDAAALCVKSGNAVILRGGKEAIHSNRALYEILVEAARECGLPSGAVQLVDTVDRAAVGEFLALGSLIDVTIPRGGKSLIERVAADATMPIIKHFDGICHVFVDRAADLEMARRIVVDSKCQRPGVCNAAETLLVDREVAETFLPEIAGSLEAEGVLLKGCPETCRLVPSAEEAREVDFRTEYLDLVISVRVVDDVAAAIDHIDEFGSGHTEAIVTADLETSRRFCRDVDSSAVMVNASTRFNDGGEFGLGAEIGISTDKFHARGPCGLRELTCYKYVVHGAGQLKSG